tara:strand:+ start:1249 stop:3699 length:2451 start_codon:yes stop_codon:yes gene_type:complete
MAEIDKALPNVDETLTVSQEEIEQLPEPIQSGPQEMVTNEDGSVDINFEENQMAEMPQDHFANLADYMDDASLGRLGADLCEKYDDYKNSRKDWEQAYITGLDLLGFKYNMRSEPFQGASGATHPVLAEAVTQFQALAYKELLPAQGPVRTQIMGISTPEKEQQAQRVKDFMNFQLMDQMKEYEPEFDSMLFYLPLAGSTFKKVYYDDVLQRAVSKFVPADELVVPYSATSLDDAEAIVHVIKMSTNDLRKQQVVGFYRDVDVPAPGEDLTDELQQKEKELEGQTRSRDEDIHTILEFHADLDLENFEDKNPQTGEETGIKLPYIVTLDETSKIILSIRRNFEQVDPMKNKKQYFVHFKFLPGLGFYGLGLIHMIGGLSRTATAALRQLLDAGTLSNLPAGFKQRGIRIRDDAQSIQPGEFRDVDAPGGNIKDSFMMLPYKEPSQTLLQLMGVVVQAGQRFASIADLQVGEGNQQAAVGTTVALLERGSRTMSAIHKRIYAALRQEFRLLAKVFSTYLPAEYPYDVVGGQRNVKAMDFDERIDILPVADPNIFSQAQRISLAQTELQLAMSNPQIHNTYNVYRNMYEALGVKDIDKILMRPQPPAPKDPALEHIDAIGNKPFQAFPGQDHRAHIEAHLDFMGTNLVRNNPMIMASLEKNVFEHISLMAQEQAEVEFAQEIQQIQALQQQSQQNPQAMQNPQVQQQLKQFNDKFEARKAVLIAEMTAEFLKEEKKATSQFDSDPLIQIKNRELDLRAQENQRRKDYEEARVEIDRTKAVMNQADNDEKLAQNERLAKLRANTSLEKTILQHELKDKE